ncbi:hypothetical protein DFR52_103702 [Hoeflea marina]|uniref:Extensin-like C-terminal domain-containing protein n=1 Tax=Hoeflea marina TaxID=274592 RepID=A0A317PLF2_9HYPH|nr:extensin family protein [Hoeflea marina]PWW00495.1 hypothetical protein DFR52_103702 [Hoeflea marina]
MRIVLGLLFCLTGLSGALAETIPVPTPAPRDAGSTDSAQPAPQSDPSPDAAARPASDAGTSESKDGPEKSTMADKLADAPEATDNPACEALLKEFGVTYDKLDPIRGDGGCSIPEPYRIIEIAPGVSVEPATQLRCEAVLALARWTRAMVLPGVEALSVPGYDGKAPPVAKLKAIRQASTYACRLRNNLSSGKVSEHAVGSAIDIAAFVFEGRDDIKMLPRAGDGTREEAFQRTMRASACLYFTTVLGPGSDSTHMDHMHLDLAERRGGFRLCQ